MEIEKVAEILTDEVLSSNIVDRKTLLTKITAALKISMPHAFSQQKGGGLRKSYDMLLLAHKKQKLEHQKLLDRKEIEVRFWFSKICKSYTYSGVLEFLYEIEQSRVEMFEEPKTKERIKSRFTQEVYNQYRSEEKPTLKP